MVELKTTRYGNFGGVDFSVDPSLVDKHRSPWAPNMIADIGGMPEKRLGWRTLAQVDAPVNGIFSLEHEGQKHIIVHGGQKMYRLNTAGAVELLSGLNNAKSASIAFAGKLWIVTGGEYLCYDGISLQRVSDIAYVPTTIIGRRPNGGGVMFEAINLLSAGRKNEFVADGSSKVYQLDATGLDATAVTCTIRGVAQTEGTDFTVNRSTGQVTFNTAPPSPSAGQDAEVIITFYKTVANYANKINKCSIIAAYGKGTPDRAVLSGNSGEQNLDWISGYNDPSYMPDLGYSVVGGEDTAILGYAAIGEYQAIIKASSHQEATMFLRWAEIDGEGEVVFPLKQGISGVGAVSKYCIGFLNDEPVFLAPGGVMAVTSNIITAERTVQNRSYYLDGRLTKENNLVNAAAVNWRGYYIVGVNGNCYILDGRNRSYRNRSSSEFVYEGYYWENVPARCWCNSREGNAENLYFGTSDGRVCRFNSDIDNIHCYNDDGQPIYAAWASPADDDGDSTRLKTMIKKGAAVTLKPFQRSSARILFRTDRDAIGQFIKEELIDIFNWEDIDFARFTFDSNDGPREILFNSKVKKYKRLQIIIANNGLDEGFGILGITKHFVIGNFAKR